MQLTKYHGLGNDFLVLLDLDGTHPVGPSDAVAVCDRHTGVGADGLLVVTAGTGGADVTMRLLNADGSVAEMSGNGIRCLAHAVLQAGVVAPPVLEVATDAGRRRVTLVSSPDELTWRLEVDMGDAKLAEEARWLGDEVVAAVSVDLGNPHLVLRWAGEDLPGRERLQELGATIDGATPGGTNVEVVLDQPGAGSLVEMVVYERGVGPTQACGTGACAVAVASRHWGDVSAGAVTVAMPGGSVEVAYGPPVLLTGDSTYVAAIEVAEP